MGAYSNRVIADGASYYWRLGDASGTVAVASVGGANGTISGGVTLGQAGAIADGSTAMAFDGTTGKIVTPAESVALAVTCTVEAWVKTTAAAHRPIVSARQPSFTLALLYLGLETTGQVYWYANAAMTGVRLINDGQWHHVVGTYAATVSKIYVDGVLDATGVGALPADTGTLTIGHDVADAAFWPGSIDDVAIYPRALTAAEVSAHYASGRTTEVSAQGPYADRVISDGASNYWRLNESSGLTARDIVGAKDGTISGGVTLGQPSPLQDGTSAMLFNGTTGKIVTAANVTIPVAVTVEAWVKVSGAGFASVLAMEAYAFILNVNAGVLGVYAEGATPNPITGPAVSSGVWHHVAVVHTGTVATFYVDGVASAPVAQTRVAVTSKCGIGAAPDAAANWLTGSVDEVAIYPRALSASEVAAHYQVSSVPEPRDLNTGLYTYLLGVFGLSSATSYAEQVRADGATNHWRLGETSGTTAVDAIGGANGTISGGVTLNQPSALADGNAAMTFDGISPTRIQTAATMPVNVTVEGWVKASGSGQQRPLLANYDGTTGGLYVGMAPTGQAFVYTTVGVTGVKSLTDGAWHHLAVVFAGAVVTIYVDGQLDASGSNTRVASGLAVVLGHNPTLAQTWLGSLDDVSIYPRALTATEVSAHYTLGRSAMSGGNDLTTLITRYLATLTGDMTARWKQMEKNAGF